MALHEFVRLGALFSCGVIAAQAPSIVFTHTESAATANFGTCVALIGDVDGDGRPELAVGSPTADRNGTDSGSVDVFAANGTVLRSFSGGPGWRFGTSIAALGDVDGDSIPDLAVGAPRDGSSSYPDGGSVTVISLRTGTTLRYVFGTLNHRLGSALAPLGDLDHDGVAEYAATALVAGAGGTGYARIWSGRTGATMTTITGPHAGEGFGSAIARAGDVDGDGAQDIAIGSPFASRRAYQGGLVQVFSGANFVEIAWKDGNTDFENLGWSVAALDADWSGDGKNDYLAGSPRNDEGTGFESGSLFAFDMTGTFVQRFDGAPGDRLGIAIAGGLDVDGDGTRDVAAASESGVVRIWSGAAGHRLLDVLRAHETADRFGHALALGDWNGDGYADAVIGAPWFGPVNGGRVDVWDLAWREPTRALTHAGAPNEQFGRHVAWVGDLDGDTRSEIAFSVPGANRVDVFRHDGVRVLSLSVPVGRLSSSSIAAAGDVNGDGVPDILVGSPDDGSGGAYAGKVRVFSGRDASVLRTFIGTTHEALGFAVAGIGDVDEDGYADVAASAPRKEDTGLPYPAESVKVWSGRMGTLLRTLTTAAPDVEFGYDLARAGDVDGDGVQDILVGAPRADDRATDGGLVQVFSGVTFALIASKSGNTAFEELGLSVGTLDGDWDGDGKDDYLAGSYRNDDGAGTDAGSLFVFNIQGNVLKRFDGAPGDHFGLQVTGGGDVDGDGYMDVAGTCDAVDVIRVYSGAPHHSLLRTYRDHGYFPVIDLAGDLDRDGHADLAVGGSFANQLAGQGMVYDLRGAGTPPRTILAGRACATSTARLPHAALRGRAVLGGSIRFELRAGIPGGAAAMNLGLAIGIPLDGIGAPGCFAYASADTLTTSAVANGRGVITLDPVVVPFAVELVGMQLTSQWVVLDGAANPLGLVTSTSATIVVGS